MMIASMRRRVFRRMLEREAGPDATPAATASAARRLSEHFARQLTPLIGDAGVAAICARSLHLAQRSVSTRAPARASEQGDGPLALLQLYLEQQEPAEATETAVAMLATAGELLASFIGEGLTTRLLCETWPDDFAGNTPEETTT
jgi:hypothetical protein